MCQKAILQRDRIIQIDINGLRLLVLLKAAALMSRAADAEVGLVEPVLMFI